MESANEAYYIGRILGFRVRNDVLDGATSSDKPSRSFVPHVQSASSTVVAKAADTRSAMTPQQLEQHDKYQVLVHRKDTALTSRFVPFVLLLKIQVRVAWFYRAKDVPKYHWRKGKGASSLDPHLLLGTMHSDVNPLVSLRGHCTVKYILEVYLSSGACLLNNFRTDRQPGNVPCRRGQLLLLAAVRPLHLHNL